MLFALLLLAGLTVAVMALTPGARLGWRGFSVAIVFAVWLALVNGVALCKFRPLLLRLPGIAAFAGVWVAILAIVALATFVVGWLDHALRMDLTPRSIARFVAAATSISALIGAALLRYFHVVAQWQARQAAGARAQVEALQARIRPHFLFNSMNTVAALVAVDPPAAERTVENLSELFRAALGSEGESTLGEELALVDRYLAIEQLRLGERLRVERRLDGLPLVLPMPRLLLQPLVENAVRHGIGPRREGGTLILMGEIDGAAVRITIVNPLPPAPTRAGNGLGLDNVRQRLRYHFGRAAGLDIARDAEHFTVIVRLPGGISHDAHPDR
jgi:two-component system sensor histidine kinase AlgZ